MSRLPRHEEHLKTGFTAEAVSAAMYRAFADQAEREEKPNLAARWRELAREKDRLAIEQLEAAGKVGDEGRNVRSAISEEQFENEVLYPRLVSDVESLGRQEVADVFARVIDRQREHRARLDELRREITASSGDVDAA